VVPGGEDDDLCFGDDVDKAVLVVAMPAPACNLGGEGMG
jgi:hypothetical protein